MLFVFLWNGRALISHTRAGNLMAESQLPKILEIADSPGSIPGRRIYPLTTSRNFSYKVS